VLVVEDERAIADLVKLYLTADGFGVHIEADGAGALSAARRLRPVACLLDIGLPGMDGTEVCRRLRESGDWTPVIFLTARDDEVDRVVGLELGRRRLRDQAVQPAGAGGPGEGGAAAHQRRRRWRPRRRGGWAW
jgi:DNA-binding response OmpR family regulator